MSKDVNFWKRRAEKAEAQLCVTAEQRAREGQSIGRSLAGATWHHYRDRAERAEAEVAALRGLAAAVYQMAGACGAPVRFLDALSAAANGSVTPDMADALLPVSESEFTP